MGVKVCYRTWTLAQRRSPWAEKVVAAFSLTRSTPSRSGGIRKARSNRSYHPKRIVVSDCLTFEFHLFSVEGMGRTSSMDHQEASPRGCAAIWTYRDTWWPADGAWLRFGPAPVNPKVSQLELLVTIGHWFVEGSR